MPFFLAFGISLSLLPSTAYCKLSDRDIVRISNHEDTPLTAFDDPYVEENLPSLFQSFEGEEDQGHGVLEINEEEDSLFPWSDEPLSKDEMPHFIEQKAHEMIKEIDDPYGYELSEKITGKKNHPSLEKIQKEGPAFYTDSLEPKTIPQTPLPQRNSAQEEFAEYLKAEEKQAAPETRSVGRRKSISKRGSARLIKK